MKKLLLLAVCIMSGLLLCQAQTNKAATKKGPRFKFEEKTHDFGDIPASYGYVTEFRFKNVGDTSLVIYRCTSSSGSVTPDWPREPILPGKSGKISVIFDCYSFVAGIFYKIVYINSNAIYDKAFYELYIKGRIVDTAAHK